jgi:16S rRNA (cytosine967-C5)-methyltransferase
LARTPWAPAAPALACAARVVEAVVAGGESADAAFGTAGTVPAEPSAVRAIALGTLRWYFRLAPAIDGLLARPKALPTGVRALLLAAAHQVEYSHHAPEAVVHAAVDAARLLDAARVAGLVNAVLRRFVAERGSILERIDRSLAARTAHPAWLADRISMAWEDSAPAILAANNVHPPMALRVDRARQSAAEYVAELSAQGIGSSVIQWIENGVVLETPRAVTELPGFAEGRVSVQDAGAQLAGPLLDLKPGQRVLDACAAPGGKTGQLLELLGKDADVTALDVSPARTHLIGENLERLGRQAHVCVGDARYPDTFWNGRPFDRILVDAPCSSIGVIRRHPDIKLLRRESDLAPFARVQLAILRAAAGLLAPGGRLVYSTCSVLPEENEHVVAALLEEEPALKPAQRPPAAALAPGTRECGVGLQLLPGAEAGTDGFYYACLEKTTAAPSISRP